MTFPDYIIKRMHQDFLAWKRAGELMEKMDQMKKDPELKKKIEELVNELLHKLLT